MIPSTARRRLAHAAVAAAPFLVAVAPILTLWGRNRIEFGLADLAPVVVFGLAIATLALGFARRLIGSPGVAAVAGSAITAVVFGYGYQLDVITRLSSRQRADELIPLVGLVDVVAVAIVLLALALVDRRRAIEGRDAARAITAAAIAWIAIGLAPGPQQSQAGGAAIGAEYLVDADPLERSPAPLDLGSTAPATSPDVYYIVLDGYGRWDILRQQYGFDNEPFMTALEERGFYVPRQSAANYPGSHVSFSSTLNMRYVTPELVARAPLERYLDLIRDNEVARAFKSLGYRYDLVRSVWVGTASSPIADELLGLGPAFGSEFAVAVANRTVFRALTPPPSVAASHLAAFDALERIPDDDAPTFTLAHIIAPHPPYVLDRDGNVIDDTPTLQGVWLAPSAKTGYIEQIRFVNRRILEVIDRIIAASEVPPVVVVLGDHGPFVAEDRTDEVSAGRARIDRLANMMAFLVPDSMRSDLYPTISPVNTFRIVLPRLVGRQPELLPDRHFPYDSPDRAGFVEVDGPVPRATAPADDELPVPSP